MTQKKPSGYWPWALTNLGIVVLIGFALWFTHSAWSLLGLIFMFSVTHPTINTKCPKCNHEFTAVAKDDDEEE